ncbi:MAG: branched-chain amino acid ABC transporter permease [Christensenellales bacterium]|jgi:branched-chain amino acid transport system permease protein
MEKVKKPTKIAVAVAILLMIVLPFVLPRTNYYMNIITSFCYFAILASSLNLLLGYTGQISLGHSAFMCIGGYAYGIFCKMFDFPGSQLVGIVLAIVISFLIGLFIGVACSRLNAIFLAMATVGFARAVSAFIVNEKWLTGGANGLTGIPRFQIFGIDKMKDYTFYLYFIALALAIVCILLCYRLVNSKTGRAFQAIKTSPIAAAAMGINVTGYKFLVCGISAGFAGLAGTIFAANLTYLSADMFNKMSVKLLTMTVAGGMGTIPGPLVGTLIMGTLPELLRPFANYLDGVYGLIIVLVFLFMPTGFYGGYTSIATWIKSKWTRKAIVETGGKGAASGPDASETIDKETD